MATGRGVPNPDRARAAFERFLAAETTRIDAALEDLLPPSARFPRTIHRAMRYSTLWGGKRLRPAMAVLAYRTAGGRGGAVYPLAAAIEMIHAFSLIHDDLPCMDDDDYRRGRPSNHKVFGEAVAVLAGDALIAEAFRILLARRRGMPGDRVVEAAREVTRAIGTSGIIGGQVVDVESAGRRVPPRVVEYIHRHKTGAYLKASLRAGGALGGAPPALMRALDAYGDRIGLAFQIADDLLDLEGTFKKLGRRPGSDLRKKKVTYPGVLGVEESRRRVVRLVDGALRVCPTFGRQGTCFVGLALFVRDRAGVPRAL